MTKSQSDDVKQRRWWKLLDEKKCEIDQMPDAPSKTSNSQEDEQLRVEGVKCWKDKAIG